jgi:hypothetical protein
MNFQNKKEVIVKNGLMRINLFHFSHRCHGLGDSERIFEPYFFSFHDFLFETCFYDTYYGQMEMNFKKPREIFL